MYVIVRVSKGFSPSIAETHLVVAIVTSYKSIKVTCEHIVQEDEVYRVYACRVIPNQYVGYSLIDELSDECVYVVDKKDGVVLDDVMADLQNNPSRSRRLR
jgi:hypothetical protein